MSLTALLRVSGRSIAWSWSSAYSRGLEDQRNKEMRLGEQSLTLGKVNQPGQWRGRGCIAVHNVYYSIAWPVQSVLMAVTEPVA